MDKEEFDVLPPRNKPQWTRRFNLLMSEGEQRALDQLATMEGLSEAALLRRILRQVAKQRGIPVID